MYLNNNKTQKICILKYTKLYDISVTITCIIHSYLGTLKQQPFYSLNHKLIQ